MFVSRHSKLLVIASLTAAFLSLNASVATAQNLLSWFLEAPQTPSVPGTNARVVEFPHSAAPGQIVVSNTDKRLYWVYARGRALAYPIAAPRPQDAWQGRMPITDKRIDPTWTPTPQMRQENPSLPVSVPGGHPNNPMGPRALYLGTSLYRIHGTDAPQTIGHPVSRGCIRMHNRDVIDLYERVPVGTPVTVTFQSFIPKSYW
ncbi:MAG: L,D-transpeptidase [Hyphomicrobiaceae bacterium]